VYYLNTIKNVISKITNTYEYQKTIKAFLFRPCPDLASPLLRSGGGGVAIEWSLDGSVAAKGRRRDGGRAGWRKIFAECLE
jgi:hypothetical protein